MKTQHLLFFAFLFLFFSCQSQTPTNKELYVCGYQLDDHNIPLESYLLKDNDSLYFLDQYQNVSSQISLNGIVDDSIKNEIFESNNKLSIIVSTVKEGKFINSLHYFKPKPSDLSKEDFDINYLDKLFSTSIPKTLSSPNRNLEIIKSIRLKKDTIEIAYDYLYEKEVVYSEKEANEIKYTVIDNLLFITIKTSTYNNRIYQIVPSKKGFDLVYYAETKDIVENYLPSKKEITLNHNVFNTCLDSRPGEYYHDNIDYTYGNKHLLKSIQEGAPNSNNDNGYITIHFTINCEGKVGRFGLEQMDTKYQSIKFKKELVKHLIDKISKIRDWNNIQKIKHYYYQDVHSFYMFKVENGKITDLCP